MRLFSKPLSLLLVTAMVVSLSACGNAPTMIEEVTEETLDVMPEEVALSGTTETQSNNAEVITSKVTTPEATSTLDFLNDYVQDNESLTFDETAWNYDEENDVYWQMGVVYCSTPETSDYEALAIYVPGVYMNATDNGDDTYTCTINTEATINGYTAETAPIVFPVNTAGYSAQVAETSYNYNSTSSYLEVGFIYVYAGMRGRSNGYDEDGNLIYSGGAPWGVTDLKAATRYYRFNEALLPGDTNSIFTFGHSGGGAQSAVMGATGDSELYYDYLISIGAAMVDEAGEYISDAITGAMAWCPITSLDYADEAYEWNMGQFVATGTRAGDTWTSALSEDLATVYAVYINELGLTDENGVALTLKTDEEGIYTSGTYYDYMISIIETSLNNFLSDTEFPYMASAGGFMAGDEFGGGGERPEGELPGGEMPEDSTPGGDRTNDKMAEDGMMPNGGGSRDNRDNEEMAEGGMLNGDLPSGDIPEGLGGNASEDSAITYETAQEYIDSLNSEEEWVTYDATTNTAIITTMEAFSTYIKTATKDVAAFDDLDRGQAENFVFGDDENDALHFDFTLASLLEENQSIYSSYSDWDTTILEEFTTDLESVDKFGNSSKYRQNMYNPMYYLSDYYEGAMTSNVAKYWRIRTGIEQGDTALTVETNLALALENYEGVESVDFETVWGQGHTTAERTGDSTDNFIAWINTCVGNN